MALKEGVADERDHRAGGSKGSGVSSHQEGFVDLTVGQRFRERRETKGLTLEEVATLTKTRPVFLRALEEDDYRFLPDELYLLGFLSEYAIFLGLNPQEIAAQFKEQVRRRKERSFASAPPKVYTFSVRKALLPLTILLVLVPFIFIGLSLFQGSKEVPGVKSTPLESPAQGAPITPPAVEGQSATSPSRVPSSPTEAATPPKAPSQHTITTKALELTWMRVVIDGEEKHSILLKPGEVTRWTAKERFVITIGNAGGVEVELDGVPLPKLGASGQVIRRLVLPQGEEGFTSGP